MIVLIFISNCIFIHDPNKRRTGWWKHVSSHYPTLSENGTIQNCKLELLRPSSLKTDVRNKCDVKMDWNGKTLKKDKRESQNFIKLRPYDSVNLGQIV